MYCDKCGKKYVYSRITCKCGITLCDSCENGHVLNIFMHNEDDVIGESICIDEVLEKGDKGYIAYSVEDSEGWYGTTAVKDPDYEPMKQKLAE